jgi:hypothetical protein
VASICGTYPSSTRDAHVIGMPAMQTLSFDNPSSNRVAPLARRMMLVLGKASKGRQTLTLANFIEALRAPDLDSMTKPPITFAEAAPFWHHTLFSFRGNVSAAAESRIGSASRCFGSVVAMDLQ